MNQPRVSAQPAAANIRPCPEQAADTPRLPLRICLVVESASGGTGRHVIDLATGLARNGDRLTLIGCPLRADPGFLHSAEAIPGLDLHLLRMGRRPGPGDLLSVWRLARLTARLGPFDVLHSHSTKAGLLTRLVPARGAVRLHTPHAARGMDPSMRPLARRICDLVERVLSWRTDRLIAVSDAEAAHLRAAGIAPKRIATIVNGVAPAVPPASRSPQGRPHVFGFVGRLVPQKGLDRLLRGFAALPRAADDARLVVVGDGPLAASMRELAADLGISARVTFAGAADSAPWYRRFDTLVLPSRYEAMPYVLLEAEAAGLPIIATDVAGTAEVIGANGLVVPNDDDPRPLAAAMALCLDPAFHATLRRAAAGVAGRHGVDRMLAETRAAYRQARGPLLLYTPKDSAVHRMHLDAVAQHAATAGMATRRIGLGGILQLRRGRTLFVQATGLTNLLALPLARLRGGRIVLYLHEPTPLARKLAENGRLKALVWHGVQKLECRLAGRIMVSRAALLEQAQGRFAPAERLCIAPLLMPAVPPGHAMRDRILYLGRPDARRCLADFAAAAPGLLARGYRPTILTGDPAGLARLLPRLSPAIAVIAEPDFTEATKARILAETLCIWNPKRGPIAQSGVTADAVRHGVAVLLTDRDPAFAPLLAAGIALDWDSESQRGFAGLDTLSPARVAAAAAALFDDLHGSVAFARDWQPWLR